MPTKESISLWSAKTVQSSIEPLIDSNKFKISRINSDKSKYMGKINTANNAALISKQIMKLKLFYVAFCTEPNGKVTPKNE